MVHKDDDDLLPGIENLFIFHMYPAKKHIAPYCV